MPRNKSEQLHLHLCVMQIELHLKIIGWLLIILGLMHVAFPRRFNWKTEMAALSLLNRQMMYVHTFFISLSLLLMGWLCVASAAELHTTPLGRRISLGMFVFWLARLFCQFFVYSPVLWKGKGFETRVHILFSVLWAYFCMVFLLAYMGIGAKSL